MANAASNGSESSSQCLIFVLGKSELHQLTTRVDQIDQGFHFGNAWLLCSRPGCSPFPLRLGTTQVSGSLSSCSPTFLNIKLLSTAWNLFIQCRFLIVIVVWDLQMQDLSLYIQPIVLDLWLCWAHCFGPPHVTFSDFKTFVKRLSPKHPRTSRW